MTLMGRHLEQEWQALEKAKRQEKRAAFLRYCRSAISLVDAGEMDVSAACYAMVGAGAQVMDVLSAQDQRIVALAGRMELPEGQRSRDEWEALREAVTEAEVDE